MIYKKDYTFIMSKKLPEGTSGDYSIVKENLKRGHVSRTYTPFGFFYYDLLNSNFPVVKLLEADDTLMSDTPMEQEGLRIPTFLARGKVLIIGLGIGLFPTLLRMHNQQIVSMLIVEQSQDVVKLVYPYIKNRKTSIRMCDGKEFLLTCEEKFDFIFIDVWGAITTTLKEIDAWTELAKPCLTEGGEVRCWLQELYNRVKDALPKEPIQPTSLPGYHNPCFTCGKILRFDYAGLCADCADDMGVSEMYVKSS